MPEAMLNVYNSLSASAQQEVNDFMMFLAQREPQVVSEENRKDTIEDRLKALYEFAGSMKDLWKGVDPVEYQRQMREDREIAW
ncbi:MAG: hypothetical protein IKQ61_09625 [Spirochaetales bacterium]|nr:hypothetical protein [Spirochaetales bacterium]